MSSETGRILLIENCDFRSFPPGGQLTFARNLVRAFGDRLALVGAATGDEPVGRWLEAAFEGHRLPFLAVGRLRPVASRPLIPSRLRFWLRLQLHRRRILGLGAQHAIVLAPETMMAIRSWGLEVCYHLSGVENPVANSRYRWARPLARWFEAVHLESARRASLLLAHADTEAIERLVERSRGKLEREQIVPFPTCVDTELFRPRSKEAARRALGLPLEEPVFVAPGRISRGKGWELLLEAIFRFRKERQAGVLVFVGDGEDRRALEKRAAAMALNGAVRVTGFRDRAGVAEWLNAADAVVFASRGEGWSNAMLEALACGKLVISTRVSGARQMIQPGYNGLVVEQREPGAFARAMGEVLELPGGSESCSRTASQFSLERMAAAHRALWAPLKQVAAVGPKHAGWVLGAPVEPVDLKGALARVLDWVREGSSRYVCLATVYSVMLARQCESYSKALKGADMVVADGMPLVWCLRSLGMNGVSRVAGPDLVPQLLEAAERQGIPVGFYGSRPEVIAALLENVRARYPRLQVAYAWSPPFRPLRAEEDARITEEIRGSGARLLFVGLGTPKQDLWMAAHRGAIPAVMVGVGQVFDLLAGKQRRAPRWMRALGLEWLFRLLCEPGRLWRRYLLYNPRFVWLFARQWLGLLHPGPKRAPGSAGCELSLYWPTGGEQLRL